MSEQAQHLHRAAAGTDPTDQSEADFLAAYDAGKWPHPALTADIAVFRRAEELPDAHAAAAKGALAVGGRQARAQAAPGSGSGLELLLVQRGNHPFRGCWALPGGFFEPGETIERTAERELAEEAGIEGVPLELFGVYSAPGRDPRDWVVTAAFLALVDPGCHACAGDDAAAVRWFSLDPRFGADGLCTLVLENGELRLSTSFTVEEGPVTGMRTARVVAHEGFAFDHEQIVADAWANVARSVS